MEKNLTLTPEDVSQLLDALDNIDSQILALDYAQLLLSEYLDAIDSKDNIQELGFEADRNAFRLRILDDYMLRIIDSLRKSLQIVPTAKDLYDRMKAREAEKEAE